MCFHRNLIAVMRNGEVSELSFCRDCGEIIEDASGKTVDITDVTAHRDALLVAMREIRDAACGETQVAVDDTEGMAWIYKQALAAIQAAEEGAK